MVYLRLIRRLRPPSPATVIALIALSVALGGTAAANLPGTNTVVSGDIRNGQVKSADIRNNGVRGVDVRESTLSEVPAAADTNDIHWAVVDVDSTAGSAPSNGVRILRDEGVESVSPVGNSAAGFFRVNFDEPVDDCAWFAEPFSPANGPPTVGTGILGIDADTIEVRPNPEGASQLNPDDDDGFSVQAVC